MYLWPSGSISVEGRNLIKTVTMMKGKNCLFFFVSKLNRTILKWWFRGLHNKCKKDLTTEKWKKWVHNQLQFFNLKRFINKCSSLFVCFFSGWLNGDFLLFVNYMLMQFGFCDDQVWSLALHLWRDLWASVKRSEHS